MITINKKDILYFIITKDITVTQTKTAKVKKFLEDNNIPFCIKYINNLSMDDLGYIVKLAGDNILDEKDLKIEQSILKLDTPLTDEQKGVLKQEGINIENMKLSEIPKAVFLVNRLMRTPISIKNGVLVAGFDGVGEYEQFLTDENRYDPKWLGANKNWSDNKKINWVIEQYKMPKKACFKTKPSSELFKFYFPTTNALYGGSIKWIYPLELVDENGYLIKYCEKLEITMCVSLGEEYKEVKYNVAVSKRYV